MKREEEKTKQDIRKAIATTLVVQNKKGIPYAVDKIMKVIEKHKIN
ncbi:MAG: hypothetical protein U9O59_01865 [Actinomycetota bacterium]|nr:hypothetical protein [Actinomycetota bacterium]